MSKFIPDAEGDQVDWGHSLFLAQPYPEDDETCKMIQTYSPQFSRNTGIQVLQVSLEMIVPSGHYSKDQQMRARRDKALQVQALKKISELLRIEK